MRCEKKSRTLELVPISNSRKTSRQSRQDSTGSGPSTANPTIKALREISTRRKSGKIWKDEPERQSNAWMRPGRGVLPVRWETFSNNSNSNRPRQMRNLQNGRRNSRTRNSRTSSSIHRPQTSWELVLSKAGNTSKIK